MDCKHARLLLAFVRPHHPEVDASDENELQQHLDGCPVCASLALDDRRADEQIGRAMGDVPVPPNLRLRLLNRVNAERDAWRRRWLLRAAGVAAAVLVTVLLAQAWWSQPAKIDPALLVSLNNHPFEKAEEVEKAFKEELGVVMVAPPELRYSLVTGYHLAVFQKQQVPYLLLTDRSMQGQPAAVAHVYVLSRNQFDWDDAKNLERSLHSGTFRVSCHKIPDSQFFYLMIYTGAEKDHFLVKPLVTT